MAKHVSFPDRERRACSFMTRISHVLTCHADVTQDLVLAESKAALAREAAARRKLHNLVQELRGNIRVFVRVRPADARSKGAPVLAVEDGQRIACTAAGATKVHAPSKSCHHIVVRSHKFRWRWAS